MFVGGIEAFYPGVLEKWNCEYLPLPARGEALEKRNKTKTFKKFDKDNTTRFLIHTSTQPGLIKLKIKRKKKSRLLTQSHGESIYVKRPRKVLVQQECMWKTEIKREQREKRKRGRRYFVSSWIVFDMHFKSAQVSTLASDS